MKVATIFSLITFCFSVAVDARYHMVTSSRKYHDFINEYQYTVLCFVDSKKEFVDRSEQKDHSRSIALFKKALKSASVSGDYKDFLKKEVGFLLVDVSKRSAKGLEDPFYFSEMPACVLLEHGEPIDEHGQPVQIAGFSTKRDILEFLDENVKGELEEIVEKKEEELEQKQAERIARYEAYGRSPWGVWGPSYYYGYRSPYYSRGYIGFGVVL